MYERRNSLFMRYGISLTLGTELYHLDDIRGRGVMCKCMGALILNQRIGIPHRHNRVTTTKRERVSRRHMFYFAKDIH